VEVWKCVEGLVVMLRGETQDLIGAFRDTYAAVVGKLGAGLGEEGTPS
jgi:hypothetical protein